MRPRCCPADTESLVTWGKIGERRDISHKTKMKLFYAAQFSITLIAEHHRIDTIWCVFRPVGASAEMLLYVFIMPRVGISVAGAA